MCKARSVTQLHRLETVVIMFILSYILKKIGTAHATGVDTTESSESPPPLLRWGGSEVTQRNTILAVGKLMLQVFLQVISLTELLRLSHTIEDENRVLDSQIKTHHRLKRNHDKLPGELVVLKMPELFFQPPGPLKEMV